MADASPIDMSRVEEATRILSGHFPRTRLIRAAGASPQRGDVFLKLESELPTGSFKVRGALYALAVNVRRRRIREVVASSTGNHGAAVAYAAKSHHVGATIFLPRNPNPVKARTIAELGARIEEQGADLAEACDLAIRYAERTGAYCMQDTVDPDIPIGAGTVAVEILSQLPDAQTLVVPVGDSALIRGVAAVAKQLRPAIRIVGVQAERAPSYYLSWQKGSVVTTSSADTIADGLATRRPVAANVAAIRELVDDMRLVTDEAMLHAMNRLLFDDHLVAEPAGAAALAACIAETDRSGSGKTVVIVSGGNVAPDVLRRTLSMGSNIQATHEG